MAELNIYGDISPRTGGYATKELLKRGQELMILERFGQFDPQGKNKTKPDGGDVISPFLMPQVRWLKV